MGKKKKVMEIIHRAATSLLSRSAVLQFSIAALSPREYCRATEAGSYVVFILASQIYVYTFKKTVNKKQDPPRPKN